MKKGWLKHAFAVDPPGPAEPTDAQREPVDWFCRQIAKRHLTTPALIGLEMSRPLNFISSSAMHFFSPAVWAIAKQQTLENYNNFAQFLENRGSVDYLCARIEHFEKEYEQQDRSGDAGDTPAEDVAGSHEPN